jgi:large subunit ribosomal protein L31
MKQGIHPEYKEAVIKCVCGTIYQTRSTRGDLNVEICAACHPFYTGNQKIVDAAGRVDRFKKKYKMK